MAKKVARPVSKGVKRIPRGIIPPTAGYRSNGSIMKCGGKKK